jgi:Spy/CpxP family protein refolding chaperone
MRKLSRLVLLSALLAGGSSLAGRPVQNFEPPPQMTEEEKAALKKQQLGGNMNAYNKDIQIEETPIPWAAFGLAGLVLLVATPFALRAYRNTTKEIDDSNTFGVSGGQSAEDES